MILAAINACDRSYRKEGGIRTVLADEVGESFANDFVDMGTVEGEPWIVVRGSDDWRDWKSNIMDDYSTHLHGRVLSWLVSRKHKYKEITLAGHSRGGVIAQHLAKYLVEQGFKIKICVTFGAPKIKDPKSHVGKYKHLRVVNGADSVPTFPPFWYRGTHGHTGELLVLAPGSRWRRWFRLTGALTHHYLSSYRKNYLLLKGGDI